MTEAQANIRIKEILKEAIEKFTKYLEKTGQTHLISKLSIPEIKWTFMSLHINGQTHMDEHIELNKAYLNSPEVERFLHDTVIHQFTHVICLRIFNLFKHDHVFKRMNKILGGNGAFNNKYVLNKQDIRKRR